MGYDSSVELEPDHRYWMGKRLRQAANRKMNYPTVFHSSWTEVGKQFLVVLAANHAPGRYMLSDCKFNTVAQYDLPTYSIRVLEGTQVLELNLSAWHMAYEMVDGSSNIR